MFKWLLFTALLSLCLFSSKSFILIFSFIFLSIFHIDICKADDDDDTETTSATLPPKVDNDIGKHSDGSKTDDEVVQK